MGDSESVAEPECALVVVDDAENLDEMLSRGLGDTDTLSDAELLVDREVEGGGEDDAETEWLSVEDEKGVSLIDPEGLGESTALPVAL